MWQTMTDVRYKKRPYKFHKFTFPTKLVMRRLPSQITVDELKQELGPLPPHDYICFEKNKKFARLYINFLNYNDVMYFKEKFDNYKFTDQKGNEYTSVVEYAPSQKIPVSSVTRQNPLCGTIEKDEVYLTFVKNLTMKEVTKCVEFDFQLANNVTTIGTTPLLKYIAERKTGMDKNDKNQKNYKKKNRQNCIIFVNSNNKNKILTKINAKKKQIFTETFS